MIYEVRHGRQCRSVLSSQEEYISKLNAELMAQASIIALKNKEVNTLNDIVWGYSKQVEAERLKSKLENKDLKKRVRVLGHIVMIQGAVIVLAFFAF